MNDLLTYVGPCEINCPLKCAVPAETELTVMPRPRHAWSDMVHCPNIDEGCEMSFLVKKKVIITPTTRGIVVFNGEVNGHQ